MALERPGGAWPSRGQIQPQRALAQGADSAHQTLSRPRTLPNRGPWASHGGVESPRGPYSSAPTRSHGGVESPRGPYSSATPRSRMPGSAPTPQPTTPRSPPPPPPSPYAQSATGQAEPTWRQGQAGHMMRETDTGLGPCMRDCGGPGFVDEILRPSSGEIEEQEVPGASWKCARSRVYFESRVRARMCACVRYVVVCACVFERWDAHPLAGIFLITGTHACTHTTLTDSR